MHIIQTTPITIGIIIIKRDTLFALVAIEEIYAVDEVRGLRTITEI